jgi:hypothetical protein
LIRKMPSAACRRGEAQHRTSRKDGINVSDDQPLIQVRRQPGDWRLAAYRLADISRMRWDYIGGGIQRRSQWHVYGFVMCDAMASGRIAHSCKHGPPPHKVKVCITKKYNEKVWPLILAKVGAKPEPRRAKRRRQRAERRAARENTGLHEEGQ